MWCPKHPKTGCVKQGYKDVLFILVSIRTRLSDDGPNGVSSWHFAPWQRMDRDVLCSRPSKRTRHFESTLTGHINNAHFHNFPGRNACHEKFPQFQPNCSSAIGWCSHSPSSGRKHRMKTPLDHPLAVTRSAYFADRDVCCVQLQKSV